jgi:hypothetical protein
MDIAYMSEGQIERWMETEILELNRRALERRRSTADLLKRLQVRRDGCSQRSFLFFCDRYQQERERKKEKREWEESG